MDTCVIVFAKNPIPNQVKTRLIPKLSAEQASALYKAFLSDWCEALAGLSTIDLIVAYTPKGCKLDMQTIICNAVAYIPQTGDDLGERLTSATEWGSENGYERIIITGSDSPTLPLDYIVQAIDGLASCDVVIGPSVDGGYYLIGFSKQNLTVAVPTIFEGIAWSTKDVLQQTVKRIKTIHAKLHLLPVWYDVDTPDDLDFLHAHLSAMRIVEDTVQTVRTESILRDLIKEN